MPVANERFPERAFPTPLLNDVVFYEFRDELYPKNKERDYGQPHPDKLKWPHHELCYVSAADASGKFQWWYAAKRENQDLYNYEKTEADISGQKFTAIRRTYVTRREDYVASALAMGAPMPNVPKDLFGTGNGGTPDVIPGYVLGESKQIRIGEKELDSLFVAEERVYYKRCVHTVVREDEETGSVLYVKSYLYYGTEALGGTTVADLFDDTENAFWGVTDEGLQNEGQQISCNWYIVTTTQLVPTRTPSVITGSTSTGILLRSYNTENDFLWPAIFRVESGTPSSFGPDNDSVSVIAPAASGDNDKIFLRIQFTNPRYAGPTKMKIEEWWVKTPLAKTNNPPNDGGLPESEVMIPIEIEHQGVNYSVRIEPTLHGSFGYIDNVGTDNPDYAPGSYGQTYTATSPFTDWPESLIANVDQRPWRLGYKVIVVTAYRPDHYIPPSP